MVFCRICAWDVASHCYGNVYIMTEHWDNLAEMHILVLLRMSFWDFTVFVYLPVFSMLIGLSVRGGYTLWFSILTWFFLAPQSLLWLMKWQNPLRWWVFCSLIFCCLGESFWKVLNSKRVNLFWTTPQFSWITLWHFNCHSWDTGNLDFNWSQEEFFAIILVNQSYSINTVGSTVMYVAREWMFSEGIIWWMMMMKVRVTGKEDINFCATNMIQHWTSHRHNTTVMNTSLESIIQSLSILNSNRQQQFSNRSASGTASSSS